MDLNLVGAFVRVVEAQSFTGAAKAMGLPKSSVSRRVTELERELGVELLHRTTRKLSLTEAGRAFFEQAGRALSGLEAAAEAAAGLDSEPRGIVRMTAPFDIGVLGLADVLAEFATLYPDIHVELSLGQERGKLTDEGYDLGVRAGFTEDASLVSKRVGPSEIGLFAAPAYLERRGRPRVLAELAQHDCVLFRGQQGRAVWRLEGPDGDVSTVEVRGTISADEILFVRQAVSAGLGIGLLPVLVMPKCAERAKLEPLERVLEGYTLRGAHLHVVTPAGAKRPRRITLLRDFLVERLAARCRTVDASSASNGRSRA
jgi:DNA-binding transcriptional LysR family regulator